MFGISEAVVSLPTVYCIVWFILSLYVSTFVFTLYFGNTVKGRAFGNSRVHAGRSGGRPEIITTEGNGGLVSEK